MPKLCNIISENDIKTLERHRKSLSKFDGRIAGQLFTNLRKLTKTRNIVLQLEGKRIKKVRAFIDGKFVMAKPIPFGRRLMLFHGKKYYYASDVFDSELIDQVVI